MKYFMFFIVARMTISTMATAATAGLQRADHEVRPKDGGGPAGTHGGGKVPRNDGVHREHDRQDGEREDVHGDAQVRPFAFRAAEAERQRPVEDLAPAGRAVTRHGQIRDERQEQVHGAGQQVGVDGQEIPGKRRVEVGPQSALVGVREQPVGEPHAAHVQENADAGLHQPERWSSTRRRG